MVSKDKDVTFKDEGPPAHKEGFPRIVIIIILAEFCERFSYSGMRAFLTLYLRSKLGYSDDGATETYHIFSMLVYIFPVFGGLLADNYLGKFRTILYLMYVYAAGNVLVAVTAMPQLNIPGRLWTLLGLLMITVGTGGIKSCVTAFGGDQFKLPQQEKHLSVYFSVMYFVLCSGSLIAKTVSPILRSEIHCFGDKDCYSLAFGAPGFIVLLSIIVFVSARSRYVIQKPRGTVVFDFVKCISLGIKNVVLGRRTEKHAHWLDTTESCYNVSFISDVKKMLSILTLFTVLPVFWSLLDQMGSRWTLQASKMDGRFGFLTIKPDQMQVLAPICILILIPLAQKVVYPSLEKRNLLRNPLHKLTLGGILAGVSFIASGSVEIYIKTTYPQLPQPGYSQLRIYNGYPCSMSLHSDFQNITYTIPPYSAFTKKTIPIAPNIDPTKRLSTVTLDLGGSCVEPRLEKFTLQENAAISFFLSGNKVERFKDNVDKSKAGFPVVRFLVTDSLSGSNITLYNERTTETEDFSIGTGVSALHEVFASTYSIWVDDQIIQSSLHMESGGVYTIVLDKNGMDVSLKLTTVTAPNSISMAWLLPQYMIMSIAEVLFAVTGNEFAFKESPESMKAVMTSIWLLTEAGGNIIIIIVTRVMSDFFQETQSFFYMALMFVSIGVFYWLSCNFTPVGVAQTDKRTVDIRRKSEILYLQVKCAEDCLDH